VLEAEPTDKLGYERQESKRWNSGNSRNGNYASSMRTSGGDAGIHVPGDRNGEFLSELSPKNSNKIGQKIIAMHVKGSSTRDIQDVLEALYGFEVSDLAISKITDKVWELMKSYGVQPAASIRTGP
jgi:transposase-like protein